MGKQTPATAQRIRVSVEMTLIEGVSESEMESVLLCDGDHWNKLEFGMVPFLLLFDHLTIQAEFKGVYFFSFRTVLCTK